MTLEEAGKIFKEYNCNTFYISKGNHPEYLSWFDMLNITPEQYLVWKEEYIIEHCDRIINTPNQATELWMYEGMYEVIRSLVNLDTFYSLCSRIIDTIPYATQNLKSYCRIQLAHHIITERKGTANETLFINLLVRANKIKKENEEDLIEKFNNAMRNLLDMNQETQEDYFSETDRVKILNQYIKQYESIKSGQMATSPE